MPRKSTAKKTTAKKKAPEPEPEQVEAAEPETPKVLDSDTDTLELLLSLRPAADQARLSGEYGQHVTYALNSVVGALDHLKDALRSDEMLARPA